MSEPELSTIRAEIATTRARLKALRRQEKQILAANHRQWKARNAEIFDRFDKGERVCLIAEQMKLPDSVVRQVLWRAGKTKRGREAVRSQMKIMQVGI